MTSRLIRTSALTVGLIVTAALLVPPAACGQQPKMIHDKTLVAWVSLANLSQLAGSALTLIDDRERFDAIVFGERAPRRWMAGSDFFRRTPGDQSAYPPETADHVGLCYDVCHQAVVHEDPDAGLDALLEAGVSVVKVQASCALEVANPADEASRRAVAANHHERSSPPGGRTLRPAQPVNAHRVRRLSSSRAAPSWASRSWR